MRNSFIFMKSDSKKIVSFDKQYFCGLSGIFSYLSEKMFFFRLFKIDLFLLSGNKGCFSYPVHNQKRAKVNKCHEMDTGSRRHESV